MEKLDNEAKLQAQDGASELKVELKLRSGSVSCTSDIRE